MPPKCLIAPPPPAPARVLFPPLSQLEEELFTIAIRLDSAVREFAARQGQVDTQYYVNCIVAELVRRYSLGPTWANIACADTG